MNEKETRRKNHAFRKEKADLVEEISHLKELLELSEKAKKLEEEVSKLKEEAESLKEKIPHEFLLHEEEEAEEKTCENSSNRKNVFYTCEEFENEEYDLY